MKCRGEIGAFASPDVIHWAPGLPKTRSGKIMRRILRKIAAKVLSLIFSLHKECRRTLHIALTFQDTDPDSLGDTSTLADPLVVDNLIATSPLA